MSDFARLVMAAESALPWSPGAFLAAYQSNRRRTTRLLVEGDSVATQLAKFAERHHDWSGMVSELYAILTEALPEGRPPSDWPGSSQWFGNRLTRAIPPLRAIGIEVWKKEDAAGTRVSIKKIAPLSPLAPQAEKIAPPREPQNSAVTGANGANGAKKPTLACPSGNILNRMNHL
jgi:hypothetical protein